MEFRTQSILYTLGHKPKESFLLCKFLDKISLGILTILKETPGLLLQALHLAH
jgi:hypothetical protein